MSFKFVLLIFFSTSISYGACLVSGEAIAEKESFNGKDFYKVMFCEHKVGSSEPQPSHCFINTEQLIDFVKKAEPNSERRPTFWENMKILGFKDKSDLEEKLTEYTTAYPGKDICLSGELTGDALQDKKVKGAAEYIAQLYNNIYQKDVWDLTYIVLKYQSGPYFIPQNKKEQDKENNPAQK